MRGFSAVNEIKELAATAFRGEGQERQRDDLEALVPLAQSHKYGMLSPLLGRLARVAGEGGDLLASLRLLNLQGRALRITGEWDAAEAAYNEALDKCSEAQAYERGCAYSGLATLKGYRGEYEDALQDLAHAMKHARNADSPALQALYKCQQAGIFSRTGDQSRARNLLDEALEAVAESEDEACRYVRSQASLGHGLHAFREGDLTRAEEHMGQALSLLSEDDYPVERGEVLRYLGVIKGALGQNAEAMRCLVAALRLFREAGYTYGQARTYNSIGRTFLQSTRLEEAIFYMEKGVRICRELRAEAELATVYGKIGNAYMLCEDYGRAVHYLLQDLELSNRFKNYYALGYTHRNLGRCYTMGGNLEDGIQHLNESLGLFQFVEDSANTARVYIDLCQANTERGKLQDARQFGQKALNLLTGHKMKMEAAYAHVVLGGIERRLGNLDASTMHLSEAMPDLETAGKSSRLAEAFYETGQLAADRGEREKAFQNLERALQCAKELGLKKHATRCFAVMEHLGDLELLQLLSRDMEDRGKKTPAEAKA
ncbi:MAG: tetratricopeptide repeat protein [Armatimonadetes bacterium]|nr:tetratricopeptide repeat protein [Armatimonadota bacterium]